MERIFELIHDSDESPPWRLLSPDQTVIANGHSVVDTVAEGADAMWSIIGEGVDWKRKAVDELDVEKLPLALRASAQSLIDHWRLDIYGEHPA